MFVKFCPFWEVLICKKIITFLLGYSQPLFISHLATEFTWTTHSPLSLPSLIEQPALVPSHPYLWKVIERVSAAVSEDTGGGSGGGAEGGGACRSPEREEAEVADTPEDASTPSDPLPKKLRLITSVEVPVHAGLYIYPMLLSIDRFKKFSCLLERAFISVNAEFLHFD